MSFRHLSSTDAIVSSAPLFTVAGDGPSALRALIQSGESTEAGYSATDFSLAGLDVDPLGALVVVNSSGS